MVDCSLKHISIEISSECNAGCIHCPQSLIMTGRPARIDYEQTQKLINEIKDWPDLEYVEFHNYNEPLLYPEYFFHFASYTRDILGPGKIGIVTNGSTMTEILAERILRLEPHHVWFSLDALTLDVYSKIRPGLNMVRVLNGIEHFWKAASRIEYPVGILFTVMDENVKEVEAFKRYWTMKGNCQIYFQWCDGRGYPYKERAYSEPYEEACDYVLENAIVLTNLDVVPCCMDWRGSLVMGNLRYNSLQEIWNGPQFHIFRKKQINKEKHLLSICGACKTALIHGKERFLQLKKT
jgi:MoaA/NifB/PqqE/SkfB family radical SAM enzyme